MTKSEFESRYNNTAQVKATAWYLQEALSIQLQNVDVEEVEKKVVSIIKEYTGESDIQLEAVLRYISAVYSMKLMRKELMISVIPHQLNQVVFE